MRWLKRSLLTGLLACQAGAGAALAQPAAGPAPSITDVRAAPACAGPDLPALWALALANNPELREAAAEVEEARGHRIQAGKYPNPTLTYAEYALGSSVAGPGSIYVEVSQPIVTAGKRRLDMAVAAQGTRIASVALVGRKFEVLTALRRAYYGYLAADESVRILGENVADLEDAVRLTRRLVEGPRTLPKADLLRGQAVLAQARIAQARDEVSRTAAWRQLAAEVGVPNLPPPPAVPDLPEDVPEWDEGAVLRRVLAVNADLHEAGLEVERARLEHERAKAEAVPNVHVGGGYVRDFVLQGGSGAIVTAETSLPLWDRQQGEIHAAEARWARAQAAQQTTANRLRRETAEAFGRYVGARQQVRRLADEVLPGLRESLRQVRPVYEAGKNPEGFVDVQTAVETLNEARVTLAEARRSLWEAVADLQGLMEIDVGEERCLLPPGP
jgi:cobalt-zinc-cadmium efflux system outer membrane protein